MVLLFAIMAVAAASPRQFDLVCDGTTETIGPSGAISPFHWEGSFDLDRELANGAGAVGSGTLQVFPDHIVFGGKRIDRITGDLFELDRVLGRETNAKCVVAPFKPMPTRAF